MMSVLVDRAACVAITCVIGVVALVPAETHAQSKAIAVATVGDRSIQADDFKRLLLAYMQQGDEKRRLEALTPAGRERLLTEEIDRSLLAFEARRLQVDRDPSVLRRVEHAIDAVLAEVVVEQALESIDRSDAALKQFYSQHRNEFATDRRRRAHHIVVATAAEADQVVAELKRGADFETLASERNTDQTRSRGGDLGWIVKGTMVKPFDDVLQRLQAGEISGVVQTSFGFHVIRVDQMESGAVRPFEAVKDIVMQRVIAARLADLRAQLLERYPVHINSDVLASISK
jgi:peptidyl-prolyl cis-trans isomerase C